MTTVEQLRAMLTRRLFGVQAWVWAVAIAGGIVAYAYLTRSRDELVPAPETLPYPDGSVPADAGDIPGTAPGGGDDFRPTTNPAWLRWVVDRMRILGEDPTLAHNAATKVLSGLEITKQEQAMWNEIVRRFGPPPEGAPPIVVTPDPPGTPPGPGPGPVPTPPPGFWYTIPRGIVPQSQNGTSKVLDAAMKRNGYPGGYADAAMRSRVWYHPTNAGVRAKHGDNPATMKMTESIYMPNPPRG